MDPQEQTKNLLVITACHIRGSINIYLVLSKGVSKSIQNTLYSICAYIIQVFTGLAGLGNFRFFRIAQFQDGSQFVLPYMEIRTAFWMKLFPILEDSIGIFQRLPAYL